MKISKNQLELLEREDDKATFNVKGYDYIFDAAYQYESEWEDESFTHEFGTEKQGFYAVSFIDVTYISYVYDAEEAPVGGLDIKKEDLEEILIESIENELN